MAFCGFTFYKVALASLNVLYLVVAFVLIALAAIGKAVASIETFSIMGGIIACGIFLLLIAIIGLVGAFQHHQVLLFFYMVILFMLFFVQFALACACLALTSSQQKKLFMASWRISSPQQKADLQKTFNCCKADESAGNDTGSAGQSCEQLKLKCCSSNDSQLGTANVCSSCHSCWEVVRLQVDHMVKAVGAVSLFFSFTEIIGVWLTMRYRNQKDPYANPNAFL